MASATDEMNLATLARPAVPPAMLQTVGADLRAARERLGWSLPDTAAYVRIRLPFLDALEAGRDGDLPGAVYATGFVRTYATALGLDAEAMVQRYRQQTGGQPAKVALDFPAPLPQRHVPAGTVALMGAVLAIGAYAAWLHLSDNRPVQVAVQQVPARLAPLALPVVPPPPARMAAAGPAAPVVAPVGSAYVRPSPSAAEAATPTAQALRAVAPVTLAPAAAAGMVLSATADSWVQVKDTAGKVLMARLMHAGDSWPVPAADAAGVPAPLVMTTGNAGGTVISLDGQALPPLGAAGAVRHDVVLDAAALKAAAATAAASPLATPGPTPHP